MRNAVIVIALLLIGLFCTKKKESQSNCIKDIDIVHVQIPLTGIKGNDIIVLIRCVTNHFCNTFSHIEINQVGNHVFDIRAKASYPCNPPPCASAADYVDTSIIIGTPQSGEYILRYLNGNTLFQSDTIEVQ